MRPALREASQLHEKGWGGGGGGWGGGGGATDAYDAPAPDDVKI